MGMLKHLRYRREMKLLGKRLLSEMPRIESNGMGLSIQDHNNYFECMFLHQEIARAVKRKRYDRLRVYDRYLDGRYGYEAVTIAVATLRHLTSEPVDTVISDNHVIIAQSLIKAFHAQRHYGPVDINPFYGDLLLLSYSAPEASERIASIVADRGIFSPRAIMGIIENGVSAAEPLASGAL